MHHKILLCAVVLAPGISALCGHPSTPDPVSNVIDTYCSGWHNGRMRSRGVPAAV